MTIKEQDFLLKRIENKATLKSGKALKKYVEKHGNEKSCELYCLLAGNCNQDDVVINQFIESSETTREICLLFKKLNELERKSSLAICEGIECIEVTGESINLKKSIQEQNNQFFSIIYNKDLDCFDMILKQSTFNTSSELLGILSFVHQIGVNCFDKLRIGAQIEQKSSVIINKSKII